MSYEDTLTLVTMVLGRTTVRSVTAYADVGRIVPGLTYESPVATVENVMTGEVAVVTIKPFALANDEERGLI